MSLLSGVGKDTAKEVQKSVDDIQDFLLSVRLVVRLQWKPFRVFVELAKKENVNG